MISSSRVSIARFTAAAAPAAKRSLSSFQLAPMRRTSMHASAALRPVWLRAVYPGYLLDQDATGSTAGIRLMTDKAEKAEEKRDEKSGEKAEAAPNGEEAEKPKDAASSEDPTAALKEKCAKLEAEVKDLKNRVLTGMADVENMRQRMVKKSEDDKKFAVRKFAQEMLEVADCLEKALESVPEDKRKANAELQTMYEGVQLIETVFLKGIKSADIAKFHPLNEKFDPNLHNAMFEMPTPEGGEKGIVGAVVKSGYMIADRVLRPAEVGVTK